MKNSKNQNETFESLVKILDRLHAENKLSTDEAVEPLQELAQIIVCSVLKTCIDPDRKRAIRDGRASNSGCDRMLINLRASMFSDIAHLKAVETDLHTGNIIFKENGDICLSADKLLADMERTLSDGVDLIQTCILSILEQYRTAGSLFEVIEYKTTDKKIYIDPTAVQWIDRTDVAIQRVYRDVRNHIQNNRSVSAYLSNYCYLEEMAIYTEDETATEVIYRRLGKYSDFGGYVKDFNGALTAYTVDIETVEKTAEIIAKLNLSLRQAEILDYRYKGYSTQQIANTLHIRVTSVQSQLKRIKEKYIFLFGNPFTD